ncbi:Aspartic peptidase [Trema orientale]|uniref:Aspartic peptidase n=1 Tax=Trema orientale TaxID=63057 RepID=A0A2P5EN02_TREOI|nr:Aspartic peptidase [Trema orientale]
MTTTTTNTISTKHFSTPSKPKPLIFKLVHSKSILSNDDLLQTDDYYNDGPFINLLPATDASLLLVNFSIGEPPIPQLAIIDTGSIRIWLICSTNFAHNHLENTDPKNIYDPSKSTSFRKIPCRDALCPGNCKIRDYPTCPFSNSYGSKQFVDGVLAMEQFTFGTSDDGIIQQQVLFGCAHPSKSAGGQIINDPRFNGVFGLGDTSLLSKIGGGKPKFSFCIGDIENPDYPYSHLQIGSGVEFEGASTPLQVRVGGAFSVVVDSISFGEELLNVDPHTFLIDTGAELTYFGRLWYPVIKQQINDSLLALGLKPNLVLKDCFDGSVVDDLKKFPSFRLHLTAKKDMVLNPINLFYQRKDAYKVFCHATRSFYLNDFTSVLGLTAMQGYNMAFDVAQKKLYINQVDCQNYISN